MPKSLENSEKEQVSECDVNARSQIPMPVSVRPLQIEIEEETREMSGMSGSVVSLPCESIDSPFNDVTEECADEFIPDNPDTQTPSVDEDIDIDIKEEDVGYKYNKSKLDGDNSIHDPVLFEPPNVGDLSGIPIKHEIDESATARRKPNLLTYTPETLSLVCETCPTTFDTEFKFREHNKCHIVEKEPTNLTPFKCSVCKTNFSRQSSLTGHMKSHTGEKSTSSLQVGRSAKRSLTAGKVNKAVLPKKKKQRKLRKVESEPEDFSAEEIRGPGVGEMIDSIDTPCVVERNPLNIEKVLSSVLNYVEDIDLRTCRLVCKEWNKLTLPFTRSRLTVDIETFGRKKIESFVKLMEESIRFGLGFPFGRFHIYCLDSTEEGIVLRFAQLCQSTVQEYILTGEVNQIILSTLLKSSPHLTSLSVPCKLRAKNRKLFKLFPIECEKPSLEFLKTLRIMCHIDSHGNCPTYFDELFGIAQSITTLDLESCYEDEDLKALEGLLKYGKLRNGMRGICEKEYIDWFELLELFKDSLISLRILAKSTSIIFPPMPKLKVLKLWTEGNSRVRCLGNECFNSTFPSLIKLFLRSPEGTTASVLNTFLTPGRSARSTVKSLTIRHFPEISMVTLRHIQSTFNFLTLRMLECELVDGADGEVVRQIWTHMTRLEGLKIYGNLSESENIDALITGIPVDEIHQLTKKIICHNFNFNKIDLIGGMNKEEREQDILRLGKKRTLPSIHNLTNLKSLELSLCAQGTSTVHSSLVTDLTGYLGFYSLKSLQDLYILRCEMSYHCVRALVEDKCLRTWKFKTLNRGTVNSNGPDSCVLPHGICDSDFKSSD